MAMTKNYNMNIIEDNNLVSIVNENFEKVDQALLDVAYTHPESGVTSGTYGSNTGTAQNPKFGGTFSVPGFAVNKEGHITGANSHEVKIPSTDKGKVDKIESGTWTPTNADGATVTHSKGYYRRFGDIVFASGYIMQSSSQKNMVIYGLPFSPAVNTNDMYTSKTDCIGQFTCNAGMKKCILG